MKVVKDTSTFGGKLYYLFKYEKGYDLEKASALRQIKADMIDKKLISADYDLRSQLSKDIKFNLPVPSISTTVLKLYCDYLGCTSDYLLGTQDVEKESKATGLSKTAINKLLASKETQKVVNSLLETNGINYITQALYASVQLPHMNNFISNQLKTDILGTTQTDKDLYQSCLKAGTQSQVEQFAIVCFDRLLHDKKLNDYFDDKATKRFYKNLDADIENKYTSLSADTKA